MKQETRTALRQLLAIAVPLMLGNFVQTIYNLTDTFFLGKLGPAEVSAPAVAFPLLMFLIVFGMGIAAAGTTLIAQSLGKESQEKVDFYLGQMTIFLLLAGTVIALIGILLSDPLLRLLRTPAEVFPHASAYLKIILGGLPFMFGFFIIQAAMQGIGRTRIPLFIQIFSVALNIPLDIALIFGTGPFPALGVTGAAVATVAARAAASVAAFVLLIRGRHGLQLRLRHMKPRAEAFRMFVKIGLPASVGQGLSSLGFAVLQGVVNLFGTPVVAAFGVGQRMLSVFNMPAMGLGRAVTSLAGQKLGARDKAGAMCVVRAGIIAVLAFLIPSMILAFFFGGQLIRFFVDDPETIRWGAVLFRIITPSIILFGIFLILTGAFQGAGDSRPVMFLNIGRLWGIRLPLAYLFALALGMGPYGIWIAMFVSNLGVTLAGYLYFRTKRWMDALDPDEV